jgi:hypothetical protein
MDRDQVTDSPEAQDKIEESIDNEMHYFNEDLLQGSVREIVEEHLNDIDTQINNRQPNEIYSTRNYGINVDVDVTESTYFLGELEEHYAPARVLSGKMIRD